ncbi:MAG TPA: hypothetical protein P5096_00095 [Patescibacteria group bacterium]|nr:hypothetical protein [Patescibacteria group bacterium]
MYNFKKFEGRNLRLEDRITITKSNSIGFPQKFYIDNGIKDIKFVVLFWDEGSKAIGIQFTNSETEKNKFSILHSKQGYGGSVVARSFFRSNNIDPKEFHGRYKWEKYDMPEVGEVYVVNLKKKEVA